MQVLDDSDDVKYKMCFATLLRDAETEPELVSSALRVFIPKEAKISFFENGLLRAKLDV